MTNAISVKNRLKKQAIEDGKTMQDKLVAFGDNLHTIDYKDRVEIGQWIGC